MNARISNSTGVVLSVTMDFSRVGSNVHRCQLGLVVVSWLVVVDWQNIKHALTLYLDLGSPIWKPSVKGLHSLADNFPLCPVL